VHPPDLGEQDEGAQARFDIGHKMGEVACAIRPDGVMVEAAPDLAAALEQTKRLLAENHSGPLSVTTFQHDGVLVRADILARDEAGGWALAEVKNSTRARTITCSTSLRGSESWSRPGSRFRARRCAASTTASCETQGDYAGLFADDDLLARARKIAAQRPAVVEQVRAVLAGSEPQAPL
jgi:hypothetical protein